MAVVEYLGRPALITEDPGGVVLSTLVGRPLPLALFLKIAAGIAAALRGLHAAGLIHRDIKPASIIVDSLAGRSWLAGLGLALHQRRYQPELHPPEVIGGTLAYMAPEQSGRMNRSIDSRSDLYSYGIVLYELLTGELPFSASSAMEWVHCHIARQAPRAIDRVPAIPPTISQIVAKLLSKSPDERYQTAAGVEADLQRCSESLHSLGTVQPFAIGQRDSSDRLFVPEALYGRECEIDSLRSAFKRVVASGTCEIVALSGQAGVGKSSIVNELQRTLVPERGLFAAGKFDQYKRDIPYAGIAQAFQLLIREILANELIEEVVTFTRRDMDSQQVRVRTTLTPDLALVLGDRVQLQQVVLNLMMNGAEAMANVAESRRDLVITSRLEGQHRVQVGVRDSGVGVEHQNASRVFDAFYTTKSGGMGMGLSITRSIVAAHAGSIWLESNSAGAGTTFYFSLERARGRAS